MNFILGDQTADSIELKCLVVSRGVKGVERDIYRWATGADCCQ